MQIREPNPTRKVWRWQRPDHLTVDPVKVVGLVATIILALTGHTAAAVIVLAVAVTFHLETTWRL